MAISNLTTQYISSSFQNLMQVSSSGQIYNGTGTQVTNLVLTSVTASFNGLINSASTAIVANTATSASYALTASYALSAAIDVSNLATTGSNTFIGNQNVTGNVSVTGTLTANTYILSSSVTSMTIEFASGSTAFGNTSDDTHKFIGSVTVTGSLVVSGSSTFRNIGPAEFTGSVISTQGFTGSLQGTARSASYIAGANVDGQVNSAADSDGMGGFNFTSYALNTSITGFATTSSLASASVATASYIDPTFISASAAASGFSSGGGSGTVNNSAAKFKLAYYPVVGTTVDGAANLEYDGTNLKLLSTSQLDFYTDSGSIYFGTFGSPSNNRVGFSVPGAAVMVIDYANVRAGFGGTTNLITNAPGGLVEIQGKADEIQLLVKGHTPQASNIIEIQRSNGAKLFTLDNNGKVAISGSLGVTQGITGSLQGTATTASYIDPSALVTSIGTAITSTTDTDSLASNTFYTVDSTSGAITISLKANTAGAEFTFFATNLTNDIAFAASGSTIVSEDSYLKMNKVGSAVTAKYYTSTAIALIGSLKA
jgi:hypothetical protein